MKKIGFLLMLAVAAALRAAWHVWDCFCRGADSYLAQRA